MSRGNQLELRHHTSYTYSVGNALQAWDVSDSCTTPDLIPT